MPWDGAVDGADYDGEGADREGGRGLDDAVHVLNKRRAVKDVVDVAESVIKGGCE